MELTFAPRLRLLLSATFLSLRSQCFLLQLQFLLV